MLFRSKYIHFFFQLHQRQLAIVIRTIIDFLISSFSSVAQKGTGPNLYSIVPYRCVTVPCPLYLPLTPPLFVFLDSLPFLNPPSTVSFFLVSHSPLTYPSVAFLLHLFFVSSPPCFIFDYSLTCCTFHSFSLYSFPFLLLYILFSFTLALASSLLYFYTFYLPLIFSSLILPYPTPLLFLFIVFSPYSPLCYTLSIPLYTNPSLFSFILHPPHPPRPCLLNASFNLVSHS